MILIAEKNITLTGQYTSELEDNDEWYVASSDLYNNRYGPQTAYTYLSNATNNWTNIPIIESFDYLDEGNQSKSTYGYQSIVTKLDELTGKYITTIIPYSSDYGNPVTYENIRVRLPKYSEVVSTEVGCDSSSGSCPLWMVNYLFDDSDSEIYYNESNGKVNGKGKGYWLLSSSTVNSNYARIVYYPGRVINYNNNYAYYGVRPVIKILKSDLFRVMK